MLGQWPQKQESFNLDPRALVSRLGFAISQIQPGCLKFNEQTVLCDLGEEFDLEKVNLHYQIISVNLLKPPGNTASRESSKTYYESKAPSITSKIQSRVSHLNSYQVIMY